MGPRQGHVPPSTGQADKSLLETLFPTFYGLWKAIRRSRASSGKSASQQKPPQQKPRGGPVRASQSQQVSPPQPGLPEAKAPPPSPPEVKVLPVPTVQMGNSPSETARAPQASEAGVSESPPGEVSSAGVMVTGPPEPAPEERPAAQVSGPAVPEPMASAVQEEKKPKPGLERAKVQEAKAQERPGDAPSNRTPAPDRSRKSPAASRPSQRYEVQATEPPLPEGLGIEAAWSEIDRTTGEASEELKMVQKARADANSIRARAQHLLDEAEAIQEEAQRVMARGRDSLAKAVSLNPRALRSVANTATALSEAMRTEWHLRRGIRQQAEEEADWAK